MWGRRETGNSLIYRELNVVWEIALGAKGIPKPPSCHRSWKDMNCLGVLLFTMFMADQHNPKLSGMKAPGNLGYLVL